MHNRSIFYLTSVVIGFLVFLSRKQNALTSPYIYAEDGVTFFDEYFNSKSSIYEPTQSAYYTIHRILFAIIHPLPFTVVPYAYFLTACFVVVAGMSVVLQKRFSIIFLNQRLQLVAFFMLLILPGSWEVHGSITNIAWWLVIPATLILLTEVPKTRLGRVTELLFLVLVGLTGFASVYMLPFASLYLIIRKFNRYNLYRLICIFFTALIQIKALADSERSPANDASFETYITAFLKKVPGIILIGENNLLSIWPPEPRRYLWIVMIIFTLSIFYIAWNSKNKMSIGLLSVGTISVLLSTYAEFYLQSIYIPFAWADRYFHPAVGFFLITMVIGLTSKSQHVRIISSICLMLSIYGVASDYSIRPFVPLDKIQLQEFSNCLQYMTDGCELSIAPSGFKLVIINGKLIGDYFPPS